MQAGDPVRVVNTKWGGRPHWEYDASYLGRDAHGDWLAVPRGTFFARPGASFHGATDQVVLVPGPGTGGAGWWLATFHAPGTWVSVYVDMTTQPAWDAATVSAVDLDLDVVRLGADLPDDTRGRVPGEVYLDDEDEFAEHQVSLGYPPEVVSGTEASAAWVLAAVRERRAPYDGSHLPWLARVTAGRG